MHFSALLKGRRIVGNVQTNAMNIRSCKSGPRWVRVINSGSERSVHAEVRAILESSFIGYKKNQFKNTKRKKMLMDGNANGIIVCRFNLLGTLKMSRPCLNCALVMQRCGIKFVVYSTADGRWIKESTQSLLNNNDLKQSTTHFR